MSPSQLFEQLVAEIMPDTIYANDPLPHAPRKANTEAKRQRRARIRAVTRRAERRMKHSLEAR